MQFGNMPECFSNFNARAYHQININVIFAENPIMHCHHHITAVNLSLADSLISHIPHFTVLSFFLSVTHWNHSCKLLFQTVSFNRLEEEEKNDVSATGFI